MLMPKKKEEEEEEKKADKTGEKFSIEINKRQGPVA